MQVDDARNMEYQAGEEGTEQDKEDTPQGDAKEQPPPDAMPYDNVDDDTINEQQCVCWRLSIHVDAFLGHMPCVFGTL